MAIDLPPKLLLLYRALDGKGDVPFETLWRAIFDSTPPDQHLQQRLGCYVTRLNRRLEGRRVEPGEAKRTYRLT